MALARISHVAFNVPRDLFVQEMEFWRDVMGLTFSHGEEGERAFFTADPLRDHEFILFAVDGPIASDGREGCMLNHVAFDVATVAEIEQFAERLRAHGFETEPILGGRGRMDVVSPAGIRFEINTPPYANPRGRQERVRQEAHS